MELGELVDIVKRSILGKNGTKYSRMDQLRFVEDSL